MMAGVARYSDQNDLRGILTWFEEQVERDALAAFHHTEDFR